MMQDYFARHVRQNSIRHMLESVGRMRTHFIPVRIRKWTGFTKYVEGNSALADVVENSPERDFAQVLERRDAHFSRDTYRVSRNSDAVIIRIIVMADETAEFFDTRGIFNKTVNDRLRNGFALGNTSWRNFTGVQTLNKCC